MEVHQHPEILRSPDAGGERALPIGQEEKRPASWSASLHLSLSHLPSVGTRSEGQVAATLYVWLEVSSGVWDSGKRDGEITRGLVMNG